MKGLWIPADSAQFFLSKDNPGILFITEELNMLLTRFN